MEQQMNNFVGLSAVLTGFAATTIAPSIDPINIKAAYYAKFQAELGNNLFFQILSDFETRNTPPASGQTQEEKNQQIGESMLSGSNGELYVMSCRKLIFLWYSGAWATVDGDTTSSQMLSAQSYTQGLAWQVMQSHPMGDSNYRYGYWAKEPADLSKYTGNNVKTAAAWPQ